MSATNRGAERKANDFYATPIPTIEKLFDAEPMLYGCLGLNILEPSAGNGNICKVIKNRIPDNYVTAIELCEEERENLEAVADTVIIDDFLSMHIYEKYDIIIGNPPFSLAQEFVEKCLSLLNNNGILILLLRTSFLESKKRHNWWQTHIPNGLYVLSERPSFTGKGTDAASYSWFVWDKSMGKEQFIRVI